MRTTHTAILAFSFLTAPTALASNDGADWPRWRGADGTAVSAETGWTAAGREAPLWSRNIGFGHSSFAIANGRLFAMGYDAERGLDVVHCLEPETGKEIWTHTYPAEFWNEGHDGGTCTTPTVDGDVVFTSNREGKLFALQADSGSVLWTRDMRDELGVTPPRWGFSGSPVIVGDTLVANVGKLAAYNKATGELRWTSDRELGNAYSTPIDYNWHGRPCLLVLNGLGLAAIDARDGSEIAFHPWTRNPERAIYGATPVIVDDHIFISASSGGGCAMLKPMENGTFEVVWESRVMRNDHAGCVLYNDHLYGFDASILKCIDLEGNEKWRRRGIGLGAVVVGGGRLLIIGAKGELIVAEATPEDYIELSRHEVLEGGAYWATPVLSHGLVYARNSLGDMVCRDHRASDQMTDTRPVLPGELPAAGDLLARHVDAVGGAAALRAMRELYLTGRGERHGGGPIEHADAQMSWSADGAFVWRLSSGLDIGYDGQSGWSVSAGGPVLLEGEQLAPIREVGHLHRMLDENWGYQSLQTTAARVFDDRKCYVVAAELNNGNTRTLYFEVDSGLLAGQEGDDVSLWTFDDYRRVGNVKVPMEWSTFAPGSGAMTAARFTDARINQPDKARFAPPPIIQIMLRSDEDNERVSVELRKKYGYLVGSYQLTTGSMTGTPIAISIEGGAIRMAFGGSPEADYFTVPDEQGHMYSMTNPQLQIRMTGKDENDVKLVFWAYGEEFGQIGSVED